MGYTKIQKFISGILIFSLLFSLTFRVSFEGFLNKAFAGDDSTYNIVSIIVQDDLYNAGIFSSDIKSEIERYSEDIQKTLAMTKVVIIPTKSTQNPYDIASINEKLYFEGYKGIKDLTGESKLIGSVFVGNIPLPLVYNGDNSQKSVLPYTDFEDKAYIYNTSSKRYEKNNDKKGDLKREIWHSFISPNTGNAQDDIKQLKDFFDKDHDYYEKSGNFSEDKLKNTTPYVFYFDQIREEKSIKYQNYLAYINFLLNIEDISYNRFSKYLADKLAKSYMQDGTKEIFNTISSLGLDLDLSSYTSTPDMSKIPDIATIQVINKAVKRFVEIFNESSLSDMKNFVHNAGRYNGTGSSVNVDMAPYLITQLDEISRIMVKDANSELEDEIDKIVKDGLSRNIAIPTEIKNSSYYSSIDSDYYCSDTFTNILFGKQAKDIQKAEDCTIYRGSNANSGTLVEANRGYNVSGNTQSDINKCKQNTSGWWGGNSPVNLNMSLISSGIFELNSHDLNKAVTPIFDIAGAKKTLDNSKTPSPLNCFDNNFIVTEEKGFLSHSCETTYRVPINGSSPINWNCATNNKLYSYTKSFNDLYKETYNIPSLSILGKCEEGYLDGENCVIKKDKCNGLTCYDGDKVLSNNYLPLQVSFKKIPSYIEHKSPNSADLKEQTKAMASPNMPIDRDRYIDFIGASGKYDKINYPYLYRLNNLSQELTIDEVKKSLKEYLDKKSDEINAKIVSNDPSKLSGKDKEIYNLLKVGNYPAKSIDLYKILETKPEQEFTINGDKKTLTYIDSLIFSLYWTKLNSVSAKYKFVFENYLSDQFGDDSTRFPLPGNKKMYEIAYIGAAGDAKNMYVSMDPAGKADNPFADIIAKNLELNSNLLSTNLAGKIEDQESNKCAPPDGVPLREWLPAVMCRLKTLLPPKIAINPGSCGGDSSLSTDDQINLEACNKDSNKNGINDCQEKISSIKLKAGGTRITYNTSEKIEASLLDEYGKIVGFDNLTNVDFEIIKLDVAKDESKDMSETNRKTIYDKSYSFGSELNNTIVLEELKKYISFKNITTKSSNGKAIANFATKNKEAEVVFRASVKFRDNNGLEKELKSNDLNILIKGAGVNLATYNISQEGISGGSDGVRASDKMNFFLVDAYKAKAGELKSTISQASSATNKYVFELSNQDKEKNLIPLSYPLKVSVYHNGKEFVEDFNIWNISSYASLLSIKETGTYVFDIVDSSGFRVTKEVEVIPSLPAKLKIDTQTNVSEIGGAKSNHLVSIYDAYGNIASGDLYNINLSIDGDFKFDNDKDEKTLTTYEGYKVFSLKSPNKTDNSTIKAVLNDAINNIKLEATSSIKSVTKINAKIDIENKNNIKVGNNKYNYTIKLTDESGNLLNGFNSKAYLNIAKIYGKSDDKVINISNGQGIGSFTTSTSSAKTVNFSFTIEGLKNAVILPVTIYPDKPIKIDLSLSSAKLEASSQSISILTAELKDRYSNLVFNDDSTNLSIEIPDDYKHVIKSAQKSKKSTGGIARFNLNATDIPGMAYIKVSSDPSLSKNSFSIVGQAGFLKTELQNTIFKNNSGLTSIGDKFFYELDNIHYRTKFNSLDVMKASSDYTSLSTANKEFLINLWNNTNNIVYYGVGENAIRIDTYYFWNKEKIIDKKYNGLYTTLLGGEYGDITTKDYLASGLLFNKNNRALAVTTLLSSNKDSQEKLLSISPNGKMSIMSTTDLSQDLSLVYNNSSRRLSFDIYNDNLSTTIGKVYFKGNDETNLSVCTQDSISSCVSDNESSQLISRSANNDYSFVIENDKLVLKDALGNTKFSISKDFTISNEGGFNISLDKTSKLDLLSLNLEDQFSEIIGNISLKLSGYSTDLSRDEALFLNKINTINNTIFVYLQSNSYGAKLTHTGNSTSGNKGLFIYYNDPFADTKTNKTLGEREDSSIANFESKDGIGWEQNNKTLLLFAAGENVGDASKYNQTVSTINLGDPVISLSKLDPKLPGTKISRDFDSSIGKMIGKGVKSYGVFDYNDDNIDDIVYLDSNRFIKLFEGTNTSQKYKDMGNLFYIKDINDNYPIFAGDFTGDSFEDVFFINTDGKPVILNNYKKHFTRIELEGQFALSGRIMQVSAFDMNQDGKMDITTLDENGDINIFYGGGEAQNPKFRKNKIDTGYGLKIDQNPRNDNSAIYYNGLYQIPADYQEEFLKSSEKMSEAVKNLNSSISSLGGTEGLANSGKDEFNENLINKLLFFQLNYDPEYNSLDLTQDDNKNAMFDNFDLGDQNDTSSIAKGVKDAKDELVSFTDYLGKTNSGKTLYNEQTNTSKITTFIRGEYSDTEGISIKKYYTDKNGANLKAGDQVSVKVEIENISSSIKKNIAYLDKVPEPLSLGEETKYKFKIGDDFKNINPKNAPDGSEFSFMIDHFDLLAGEKAVFEYTLTTLPFNYGFLQTGLFEEKELGNDDFGDILLKKSKENCSQTNTIYRSLSQEEYQKGEQAPICNNEKSKLPEEVEKNATDKNGNGIPDYIDNFTKDGGATDDFTDYAKKSLNQINFDRDGDGIPDTYDILNNYNDDSGNILDSLNNFTANSMQALNGVESFINGLGCGTGGAGCIASPLNAAPLAPGSSLTAFGCPIAPAYPSEYGKVGSGLPVFAVPTGAIPFVWPPNPASAGGIFDNPYGNGVSQFRLFLTPTLTGGFGMAFCMGSNVASYGSNPMGISPILPGGNCIVTAQPMNFCSNDGSDGDVASTGYSQVSGSQNYQVYNGNCKDSTGNSGKVPEIDKTMVKDYINYKRTGQKSAGLTQDVNTFFGSLYSNNQRWRVSNGPFVNIGGASNSDSMDLSMDLDLNAIKNGGSYSDILKINMKRIWPFPDFLMEWWTRQIEEIVTKLTDWPTVFVILPDFSGIIDSGWSDLFKNIENAYNKGLTKQTRDSKNIENKQNAVAQKRAKCTDGDTLCDLKRGLDNTKLEAEKFAGDNLQFASGIKQVYEFLGNLPMISIIPEKIYISVPWIDSVTIDKAIRDFKLTQKQWQSEIDEKQKMWTLGESGCGEDQNCKNNYAAANSLSVNAGALVNSLNQNIYALEEYKKFPEKLNKYITIKERWLGQILCNVETISYILGGRLGENGKRFKAWVELYVLVKAILKSWQLILDVFYDYDASCHDCKNERNDLVYCVFKIISMIIPKIPVIQFPKWPDIIVDLHNIRAGLTISLPEFEFKQRPIVLPHLPRLYLPDTPKVNINLPSIPVLPLLELPELPDLPSLPTVTLPDLPPPPKLPKLFAGIEGVLNILKLITKAMCILKMSPFVPEWRAGDQIAFLSERGGFLPTDFLSLSLPQFSYPFVDAIKVTSYVNLEFEADFLTEMARNTMMPINTFSNNIANMFNIAIPDLDFRGIIPQNVDVNVGGNDSGVKFDGQKLNYNEGKGINLYNLSILFAANITKGVSHIMRNKELQVTAKEFLEIVNKDLAKKSITKDENTADLRKLWVEVNNYDYSKEDKIIKSLIDNNNSKFDSLKTIINKELEETRKLKEKVKNNTLSIDGGNKLVSSDISRFNEYNSRMSFYNDKTKKSLIDLVGYENSEKKELTSIGNKLVSDVSDGAQRFSKKLAFSETAYNSALETAKSKYLANVGTGTTSTGTTSEADANSCKTGQTNTYTYKGLYVVQKDISYRLFDYLDELTGSETTKTTGSDEVNKDLLYQVGDELYLKNNLKAETNSSFYTGNPIELSIDDIKYYNKTQPYYPAINGFSETIVDSNNINIKFAQASDDISNYRLEFYNVVDKFNNDDNTKAWNGIDTRRQLVDSFRDIEDVTISSENENYTIRNNLAYLDYYAPGLNTSMSTKELVNIKDKLKNNKIINLGVGTKVYAGGNDVELKYYIEDDQTEQEIIVKKHQNISFKENIIINGINGDAYLEGTGYKIYTGNEIAKMVGLPIFPQTTIRGNSLTEASRASINYYDGTNTDILFRDIVSYTLYDLGYYSDTYLIRTKLENDFYYSKISGFKKGIFSTISSQQVMSPQIQADTKAPEIDGNSNINIPVYVGKTIDLTEDLYENSGISSIKEVYIDSNLKLDSNGDGNPTNDKDPRSTANIQAILTKTSLKLEIDAFDSIFTKNIRLYMIDSNNNIGYKDIVLNIYSPTPQIKSNDNNSVYGDLNEEINGERVDIYRFRGGVLKRLTKDSVNTTSTGAFNYNYNSSQGLVLKDISNTGTIDIAKIDELTGKINSLSNKYSIRVIPSNLSDNSYTNIVISDGNIDLYYEYIVVPNVGKVEIVDSFDNIKNKGTYFKLTDKRTYSNFVIPTTAPYNPGDLAVYDVSDNNKTPIFLVTKDGRISVNREGFKIVYETFENRVVYKLVDGSAKEIARVMPISEGNFIMK